MMITFQFRNPPPEDLSVGQHGSRIVDSEWKNGDIVITLDYRPDVSPDDSLFPIVKHDDRDSPDNRDHERHGV